MFLISGLLHYSTLEPNYLIYSTFSGSLLIAVALVTSRSNIAHWFAVGVTGFYALGMVWVGLTMSGVVMDAPSPPAGPIVYVIPMIIGFAGALLAALRSRRPRSSGIGAMSHWVPIWITAGASIVGQFLYLFMAVGGTFTELLLAWIPSLLTTLAVLAILCLPAIGGPVAPFAASGLAMILGFAQIVQLVVSLTSPYAVPAVVAAPLLRMFVYFAAAALLIWVGAKRIRGARQRGPAHQQWN